MQDELQKRIKRTPTASIPSEQNRMDVWTVINIGHNSKKEKSFADIQDVNTSLLLCAPNVVYTCVTTQKEIVLWNFTIINIIIYIIIHLFT